MRQRSAKLNLWTILIVHVISMRCVQFRTAKIFAPGKPIHRTWEWRAAIQKSCDVVAERYPIKLIWRQFTYEPRWRADADMRICSRLWCAAARSARNDRKSLCVFFCYGRPAHSIRLSSQGLYIDFWPSWTQNHVEYSTKILKVSYKRAILTVRVGLQPPSLVYESRQPFCDKILRRHNIMNPHWVPRNTLTENLTQTSRVSQRWSRYLM